MLNLCRCEQNPIIEPGLYPWRMATVFNPGVLYEDGVFYLYERAAGGLRPFHCYIGLLTSRDGVHFEHATSEPVFTPEMAGSRYGSVQDPRVVALDGRYYMTYAYRPYAWSSHPTGVGVPHSVETAFPGFSGRPEENQTRSGIAVSEDKVNWRHLRWATPADIDDRDVILFPERIGGRYVMLRRPLHRVGPQHGTERPSIWLSYSDNLEHFTEPELLIKPEYAWEGNRIGGAAPPIRTDEGWLVLYHGVEDQDQSIRRVVYRAGALLLDLDDPRRVIARTSRPILEPSTYYERFGLYIPNVVFPTGAVVREGLVYIYYGVCDTAIALATVPLRELVHHVRADSR
jgi:predicted GH43/DUF377 family glycosyl hydrolase